MKPKGNCDAKAERGKQGARERKGKSAKFKAQKERESASAKGSARERKREDLKKGVPSSVAPRQQSTVGRPLRNGNKRQTGTQAAVCQLFDSGKEGFTGLESGRRQDLPVFLIELGKFRPGKFYRGKV